MSNAGLLIKNSYGDVLVNSVLSNLRLLNKIRLTDLEYIGDRGNLNSYGKWYGEQSGKAYKVPFDYGSMIGITWNKDYLKYLYVIHTDSWGTCIVVDSSKDMSLFKDIYVYQYSNSYDKLYDGNSGLRVYDEKGGMLFNSNAMYNAIIGVGYTYNNTSNAVVGILPNIICNDNIVCAKGGADAFWVGSISYAPLVTFINIAWSDDGTLATIILNYVFSSANYMYVGGIISLNQTMFLLDTENMK